MLRISIFGLLALIAINVPLQASQSDHRKQGNGLAPGLPVNSRKAGHRRMMAVRCLTMRASVLNKVG